MIRRVVVTGIGSVTPLGVDVHAAWERMKSGESGVGPITLFDATDFPVRIAAEAREFDLALLGEDADNWAAHARQTQFAVAAGKMAADFAGLSQGLANPLRMGVYLGCGEIFPNFAQFCRWSVATAAGDQFPMEAFLAEVRNGCRPDEDLLMEPGAAAAGIASLVNAQGPNANFTAACVSSSKAIGEAAEVIRRGDADVMLAGGAHSMVHPFGITGFHRLSTLSTHNDDPPRASRPFDRNRDGFVIGEGGVVLVLEDEEHARRRDAEILAEFDGWGVTHDAYRITDLEPEGKAAARSIRLALDDAHLNPEQIDYINAHGSGTVVNDKAETAAVKRAMGDNAYTIPISSTKSMTGHQTTACGAVEAFACVMALRDGVIPATINYETPDPDCDLDYVPNSPREIPCQHVLSNSFGFGGQNVAIVLSRYAG